MSTFEQATGQTIETAFLKFDATNPKVYMFFSEQCFRAIRLNKSKISSKQILGYIRWEVSLITESEDGFKINDAFTSRYARKFATEFPEHEDLFDFRELRDGTETKKRAPITNYQADQLRKIYEGAELWETNASFLIFMKNKVQNKIETRTVELFLKLKFIAKGPAPAETGTLFLAQQYGITIKGIKYLTQGMTP